MEASALYLTIIASVWWTEVECLTKAQMEMSEARSFTTGKRWITKFSIPETFQIILKKETKWSKIMNKATVNTRQTNVRT